MTTDDGQLVARAAAGDAGAFTEIVRRHRDMVYGYCYHRTGSFEDARDLAQDTFVRAYTSLGQLRDHAKLAAWLRRIAANLCARWHERRREMVDEIPDRPEPTHRSAASECVGEALANLPENERLAIVLHYVNGYSYGDIAGFLEVTKAAVRGRLHRGRELLRAEVLKMTLDAFDENRLDEKFVMDAVQTAVREMEDAYNMLGGDEKLSRKKTDEAAALVDQIRPSEVEDPVALGNSLFRLGMREFILDERERAHKHWDRARSLFEQAGDDDGIELWRGAMAYERLQTGDLVAAHELFSQTAEYQLSRRLQRASGSLAAARALESLGLHVERARILSFLAGAGSLQREDGQTLQEGAPGFGFQDEGYPARFSYTPGPPLGPMPLPLVLIRNEPSVGDRLRFVNWGGKAEESVFETLSDTITTPAGTFTNCARSASRVFASSAWEGEVVARRKLWIAPGVGVVKIAHQAADGPEDTSELADFHIQEPSSAYIPLAVGNWWKYHWIEGEVELGFRTEFYREIVASEGDRYPTIHYSFCVKR